MSNKEVLTSTAGMFKTRAAMKRISDMKKQEKKQAEQKEQKETIGALITKYKGTIMDSFFTKEKR